MGAADFGISDADLDLLDIYLLSDQSPPECMLLSDLDGFLTGVAIGAEVGAIKTSDRLLWPG